MEDKSLNNFYDKMGQTFKALSKLFSLLKRFWQKWLKIMAETEFRDGIQKFR